MAHRNNDIFGAGAEAPRRAPSSHRPADSDIFSSHEQQQRSSSVKTTFPGMSGEPVKAGPRGDHGRSIHDAKIDLGGGYGDNMRASNVEKHLNNENDKAAGFRGSSVIVKQTESSNIFGAPTPLAEPN